ncbi:serine hydrolase domain-containing protein [Adhaeribacter pallidiroseus]|uniref:Serine-type D-Ala-D-Ala carboxypeptidase n=1 Tax=Adhaeribacter pallidiroseus TaxID=2072847 RepID=A0A369QNJ8_9BACT|nr:serine hydrolase domain-containing protein [Adhaeribacter pallidiroseus]RDC64837.1 Serine-type D-Ala-D-Ala carboxypeptidase [Adhaeribacter pallidiroseus]
MKAGRLLVLAIALFLASCQKEDGDLVAPSPSLSQNYLTAFKFLKVVNPQLPQDLVGQVSSKNISLQVPAGVAFNKLIASFTNTQETKVYVNNTEQVSGETENDFSNPIVYKVIAPNGSAHYINVALNSRFPEMDQAMEELRQKYQIPGLTLAIVKNEKLVFAKGYGYANVKTNLPVDNQSLFRIASISKPITVVAILKLVQAGQLKLTDKVFGTNAILGQEYGAVPVHSNVAAITVQNLIEHKSGWTNQPNDPIVAHPDYTHKQLITEVVQNRPLTYAPGTEFYYSNFGYCVLGRIIEKISGKSYAAFVQTEVLQPMGIIDMQIAGNSPQQSALNEVTYYQADDNPYAYNISRMDANGGWLATAADLMRFMVHIDRNSKKGDLITSDLLNQTYMGYYNWSHTGSLPGTSTLLTRLDDEYSFAVLANTRNNSQPFQITEAFSDTIKNQILLKTDWPELDLFTSNLAGTQ